jgi:hypothetical protein
MESWVRTNNLVFCSTCSVSKSTQKRSLAWGESSTLHSHVTYYGQRSGFLYYYWKTPPQEGSLSYPQPRTHWAVLLLWFMRTFTSTQNYIYCLCVIWTDISPLEKPRSSVLHSGRTEQLDMFDSREHSRVRRTIFTVCVYNSDIYR